ncbi:hypothetical protein SAMN02910370_01997 [Lachnospiraceae bacterium XPB1003]|nr:hypothetical protein SAMN02910370_01997 [Lachnospiraceae bacterium XPB1003]
MEEFPTGILLKKLEGIRMEDIPKYLDENRAGLRDDCKAFYYHMKNTIEKKGFFLKDVYLSAGVSESYGGKIITMEKHTKNRDLIIRLCLAGHFNLIETNRALKLYGMSELYPKISRDACIIVAINNHRFDRFKVDESLKNVGLRPLSETE